MASVFLCKVLLISILSSMVNGLTSPMYQTSNLIEKSDDFNSRSVPNENSFFFLNRPSSYLGDGPSSELRLNGKENGIPILRFGRSNGISDRYYIPMSAGLNKRGGKLILVDVLDFVNKNGEKIPSEPAAIVVPEKVVGGNMRFSGK